MKNRLRHNREDIQIKSPPLSPEAFGNERGFWRNIIGGKRQLTATQGVGIFLMYLVAGVLLWSGISSEMGVSPRGKGPFLAWVFNNFGGWIIVFIIFVLLLLLLFWRIRCTQRRLEYERLVQQKAGPAALRNS